MSFGVVRFSLVEKRNAECTVLRSGKSLTAERRQGIVTLDLAFAYGEWTGPGSNRRHQDFQSCALPTELPVQRPTNVGFFSIYCNRGDCDKQLLLYPFRLLGDSRCLRHAHPWRS